MYKMSNADYMVLDDTILLYKGRESNLTVPSVIEGHEVKCIGEGAIFEKTYISSIEVSEGIESIGNKGIGNLYSLRKLVLPQSLKTIDSMSFEGDSHLDTFTFRVKLSEGRYKSILAASYGDSDGHRIIDGIPSDITSMSAFNVGLYKTGFGLVKPIAKISRESRHIYIVPESKAFSFSLTGGESGISEMDDVMDKIRGLQNGSYINPVDNRAEIQSDGAQRKGEDLKTSLVLVPVFYESDAEIENGMVKLTMELMMCKAYWLSVQKIVSEGVSYYAKNYCYYTADSNCPYINLPAETFYTEDGESVKDLYLISKLRRKARFLNMI